MGGVADLSAEMATGDCELSYCEGKPWQYGTTATTTPPSMELNTTRDCGGRERESTAYTLWSICCSTSKPRELNFELRVAVDFWNRMLRRKGPSS